jgi:hypothetical protein
LKGEKADRYLTQVKAAFTANLADGMNKLATAMTKADPSRKVQLLIDVITTPASRRPE